ncbi:MAG: hypothetical protein JO033_09995 [Acidobacteriaceae bacterium]|nr:hypothetical protein [Acidobacteriaceae bacterium]
MGDLIDRIDVVHVFHALLIALMHGIDPQVSRLALWIRLAAFAYLDLPGSSLAVTQPAFAIAPLLAQVIQMGHEISARRSNSGLPHWLLKTPGSDPGLASPPAER